jgi:hypothetical protein
MIASLPPMAVVASMVERLRGVFGGLFSAGHDALRGNGDCLGERIVSTSATPYFPP